MSGSGRAIAVESLNVSSGTVEGPLGSWAHHEARPRHLAGLVEFIWLFDGWMTCLRERTFPNGLLEVIVHLGDRYRVVEERGSWVCPPTCVTGLQLGHLIVEAPSHRTRVLGVRLTPAGAYALFARPMHELSCLTVDLEDLTGAAASELADRCHAGQTVEDCLEAAAAWVQARFDRARRIDPGIAWMVSEIQRHRGAVSIGALRGLTGYSKSRLASTFQQQVGVTPKQYARVIRFSHALKKIHAGVESLTEIALDTGYYDQPHLNAEFKALSGFTPSEFLSSLRYPNSVSVAEETPLRA
jgi:AraC-like DNA-binding protein